MSSARPAKQDRFAKAAEDVAAAGRAIQGLFMGHTPTYRGTGVGTGFQNRSCANKNALLIDAKSRQGVVVM